MDYLSALWDQVWSAPSLVWYIAALFSAVSAYLLHTFIDDQLFASFAAVAMFVAIMIANIAFADIGIFFAANRDTNIIASAAAATCSLTVFGILLCKIWFSAADARHRARSET